MQKTLISFILAALFTMVLTCQASWAAKAYITDPQDVPLRAAPGKQKKILVNIPSGAGVEILKGEEWTLVRYTQASGTPLNGWVPTAALGARPPEAQLTKELEEENTLLKERVASLEREKTELAQKQSDVAAKLSKVEHAYDSLKTGSTDYLKLKEQYDSAKSNLESAQEEFQTLKQENDSLKLSQRIKWFAAGGMVLLAGWFIGWITGRQGKKRRSNYFF